MVWRRGNVDEGILEVDVAEDRVAELRVVGELHGVGLITCEGEVIVKGDEGPVRGVAQVVDCHGVTVSHEEKEEEEERQEVESDEEKTLKERCACPWMGWIWKTSANGLSQMECDVNKSSNATKDSVQVCSSLHFARVYVRRVIHVIVHNGLTVVENVLVVVHTLT